MSKNYKVSHDERAVTTAAKEGGRAVVQAPRFTPGPWWVEVNQDYTNVEAPLFTVATDVTNADAHLIAAAPEMLAELLNVVRQAEANPFLSVGMLLEHHSGIRAALAKAEGRE